MSTDPTLYVRRDADDELDQAISRREPIVLLKGARGSGKSEMLARALSHGQANGNKTVLTDLQTSPDEAFTTLSDLYRNLGDELASHTGLDMRLSDLWQSAWSPGINFDRYLRRRVLRNAPDGLIWGLDGVDRLFPQEYRDDFFGHIRSIYNDRAIAPSGPWSRFTIVMTYSREAHLLIRNLEQSPFNVGARIELADLTFAQVAEMNAAHGNPLRSDADVARFLRLIGGLPLLVELGLTEMARRNWSVDDLAQEDNCEAVYGEHLATISSLIALIPELGATARQILMDETPTDVDAFDRLRAAGIMIGESVADARLRCLLYATHLERLLL